MPKDNGIDSYTKRTRRNTYIALERLDFTWELTEVREIDQMYNAGIPLWMIAQSFARDPDEVAVLLMDRCRKGVLKPRNSGIYGKEKFS